jgi:uncharacterized protein (TIGR04255 family)
MNLLGNSPLIEAVCEIVFMPSPTFDLTLPGILFSELKGDYPIKKDNPVSQVIVPSLIDKKNKDIIQSQYTQFFSSNKKRVVQISKDVLTINFVAPYSGWDEYKNEILRIINIYKGNFENKLLIRQISLRYLNRFELSEFDPINNFSFKMPIPDNPKYNKLKAYNLTTEFETEYEDVLASTIQSVFPNNPTAKACILTIQNINNDPNSVDIDMLERWLNNAHKTIKNYFIDSLKKTYYHTLK